MYDEYDQDTDYSQLDYSDDYVSKSKHGYDNDSKKREKKLLEEVALLRKMLR